MLRHLSRTAISLIALGVCLMYLPTQAQAQGLGGGQVGFMNDPFSFYYGVYLPNQQQQSLRPRPMDTINQAMVNRQYYARNANRALTSPISPYSDQDDPLRPYSKTGQGQERIGRPYRFVQDPSNSDGSGPSLYYGRAAQYFPGLAGRDGRGANANVYSKGSRALSGA
ncbi:MAG: hypothetical protein ACHRXM_39130, partial [Isosphaerales bacterium]